jgi:hypothetical protein
MPGLPIWTEWFYEFFSKTILLGQNPLGNCLVTTEASNPMIYCIPNAWLYTMKSISGTPRYPHWKNHSDSNGLYLNVDTKLAFKGQLTIMDVDQRILLAKRTLNTLYFDEKRKKLEIIKLISLLNL